MRTLGLVIACALLAVGLYRAFFSKPAAAKPALPPGPQPKQPAPPAPAKAAAATKPDAARPPAPPEAAAAPVEKAAARPADEKPAPKPAAKADDDRRMVPSMLQPEDSDEDITIITLAPSPQIVAAMNALAAKAATPSPPEAAAAPPRIESAEPAADEDDENGEAPSAVPIVYDEDAAIDEPTRVNALILVSAASQTDQGRRRRRNEDSLLVLDDHHLYVVADGMGGHAGGDVASKMAVETIGEAFKKNIFDGEYPDVPRRGGELAVAIQMANKAIFEHARANAAYQGMGTTVVSARFSPNKQRVYVGHVGDSRCYRLRGKQLTQITTDHTMGAQGVTGPLASHLNRAVGVGAGVKVDLLIARPRPEDVYLLCTDGLSKMVSDADIQQILLDEPDLGKAVQKLVERANAKGGRDNITVILVQVKDPKGLARYIQQVSGAAAPS
ncbi:MAG: protein phosphatase 2C domain-containing protein [Minicystis sp.]